MSCLVHSKYSINAKCYFYCFVASSFFISNFVFPLRKGKFWSYYALANILQQLPFNNRIKGIFLGMAYQNLNDPALLVKYIASSLPSMLHLVTLFFLTSFSGILQLEILLKQFWKTLIFPQTHYALGKCIPFT